MSIKRLPTDLVYKIRHQFTLYLQRCGVTREMLPPDQLTEMSRAFYGACGQMIFLFRDDLTALKEEEIPVVMEAMCDELEAFWTEEQRKQP